MTTPNYLLLAVNQPLKSAELYGQIFAAQPVERSENFVLYVLPNGFKVGLWSAKDMAPAPRPAGGVELSFSLPSEQAVRETFEAWKKLGLEVLQAPTHLDFGFTCVLADADGHRLRPFALAENPR